LTCQTHRQNAVHFITAPLVLDMVQCVGLCNNHNDLTCFAKGLRSKTMCHYIPLWDDLRSNCDKFATVWLKFPY